MWSAKTVFNKVDVALKLSAAYTPQIKHTRKVYLTTKIQKEKNTIYDGRSQWYQFL